MAADDRRRGLLARGLRRRHLRLRRRPVLRLDREHARSTSPSWAWRRRPTAAATGWSPPTAASSPTATPQFYGSTGSIHLNKPIVGMAADARRRRLLAGRLRRRHLRLRRRRSSTARPGAIHLNQPIVAMAADARLAAATGSRAADGGLFNYGDAPFLGRRGQQRHRDRGRAWRRAARRPCRPSTVSGARHLQTHGGALGGHATATLRPTTRSRLVATPAARSRRRRCRG